MKMKMNTYLIALLVSLFPTVTLAQQGAWEQPWFNFGPSQQDSIVAVHLIHVFDGSTGKVVAITYETAPGCVSGRTRLWTPPPLGSPAGSPGVFETVPNCRNWLFCCGHSALADGRILTVGGHYSYISELFPFADLFDPVASAWNLPSPPENMAQGRWYPTATTLWDGTVLATSGTWYNPQTSQHILVTVPELYNLYTDSWIRLFSAERAQPLYPNMFVLPDGNLVHAGPGGGMILVSPTPTSDWTWSNVYLPDPLWQPNPPPPPPGWEGSAVMYAPGEIMKCGGLGEGGVGVTTTWVVDLNPADPYDPPPWVLAGEMNHARIHHNLVILPDGKVLVVGGQTGENGSAVYHAEIFDPASAAWTEQLESDTNHPRMYHSTAMLLRDGRVVSAGGDDQPTAQIFKPPYITSGAPRPTIVAAPAYMHYGQPYTITYSGPEATKACLIRLAAVTHGFDQDQRRVPLSFPVETSPPYLTVVAPPNGNVAPPGYYMLFILNEYAKNQFAPCVEAKYVQVGP